MWIASAVASQPGRRECLATFPQSTPPAAFRLRTEFSWRPARGARNWFAGSGTPDLERSGVQRKPGQAAGGGPEGALEKLVSCLEGRAGRAERQAARVVGRCKTARSRFSPRWRRGHVAA